MENFPRDGVRQEWSMSHSQNWGVATLLYFKQNLKGVHVSTSQANLMDADWMVIDKPLHYFLPAGYLIRNYISLNVERRNTLEVGHVKRFFSVFVDLLIKDCSTMWAWNLAFLLSYPAHSPV